MWRQAFGLDNGHDTHHHHHHHTSSSLSPSSCFSGFEGGSGEDEVGRLKVLAAAAAANGTFYNDVDSEDEDRGMKSRWSFSSASASSLTSLVGTNGTDAFGSEGVSVASSSRLMYLIPRLLFLTKSDDGSTRERSSSSSGRSSANKVGSGQKQQIGRAPLSLECKRQPETRAVPARPPPPPPLFGTPSSSSAAVVPAPPSKAAAEIQQHRNVTLQKLEGSYVYGRKERYLSTFRSIFRTPKPPPAPTTAPSLPNIPTVAPLRLDAPIQDPGRRCRISGQEWANLRDDIVRGLSADAEALFPFFTDDQRAAFLRVEQKEEGNFKVEYGEGVTVGGVGGVKEALERIERRNWEDDVLFVEFEDTPRTMRWWYTTREPQVFEWGAGMI